ncbi:hypothetical protein GCM10010840_12360 [Deinococcus aerolatus]|uniref:VCBS repeat-containing protein n=1 Tax=Deinococcus aerolatus TaxID=522487 RepID=A0ABQ2G4Z8_9DEIO|nr:hypothetical protein [Deinococcus aerolatus]GGL75781.1 hypothetical protein GCM10010840_12360 [Deinococcus aerolatus]
MTRPFLQALLLGGALMATGAGGQTPVPGGFFPVLVHAPGDDRPQLLGAAAGGRWLTAAGTVPRLKGQERYLRRSLGGPPVAVTGDTPESFGEPCPDAYAVAVRPAGLPDQFQVFTAAGLNARPRPVTALPVGNETYRQIVRTELLRRGLNNPKVRLVGLTRSDLDGDGTLEVLIEATSYGERSGIHPPPVGQPGDYSLVLLRHVVRGQVLTVTLGADIAPQTPVNADAPLPTRPLATLSRLAGIADLNGDGRMELVLYGAYYEGSSYTVNEWTPARGLTDTPLQTGCGV